MGDGCDGDGGGEHGGCELKGRVEVVVWGGWGCNWARVKLEGAMMGMRTLTGRWMNRRVGAVVGCLKKEDGAV